MGSNRTGMRENGEKLSPRLGIPRNCFSQIPNPEFSHFFPIPAPESSIFLHYSRCFLPFSPHPNPIFLPFFPIPAPFPPIPTLFYPISPHPTPGFSPVPAPGACSEVLGCTGLYWATCSESDLGSKPELSEDLNPQTRPGHIYRHSSCHHSQFFNFCCHHMKDR